MSFGNGRRGRPGTGRPLVNAATAKRQVLPDGRTTVARLRAQRVGQLEERGADRPPLRRDHTAHGQLRTAS